MFADIGGDFAKNLGNYAMIGLAVAGAAAVGYFAALAAIWLVGKLAFNKQPPKPVARVLAILSGVALALLIAGFLTGGLGGFGGGGGWWPFGKPGTGTEGTGNSSISAPNTTDSKTPKNDTPTKIPDPVPSSDSSAPLQVVILDKARIVGNAYYLLRPENTPKTLGDLERIIQERKQTKPPLKAITIISTPDSVGDVTSIVSDLEALARREKLAIGYDGIKRE